MHFELGFLGETELPDSAVGAAMYEASAAAAQDKHARRPPAKRPNYRKLGTDSPFAPDWSAILGSPGGALRVRIDSGNNASGSKFLTEIMTRPPGAAQRGSAGPNTVCDGRPGHQHAAV